MLTREKFIGPWAGLPVAWTDDDKFDEATYRGDVRRCCRVGAPGVYTGGTTGEFYALDLDEFKAVAKATIEECHAQGKPVMIGCTSTYTLGAARRAALAAEWGADAIQVALPFWMVVQDAQVVPFFAEVSEASGGLPLSIYNNIKGTGRDLPLDLHQAIKQAVPNYLMVKTGPAGLTEPADKCQKLSEFINVFTNEQVWDQFGPQGANGCCSALVYWNPRITLGLWQQVQQQNWPAVQTTCDKLRKLIDFVIGHFGPKGFRGSAYDRLGGLAGGFIKTSLGCRGPYRGPTPADVQVLRGWYKDHFPEMLEL